MTPTRLSMVTTNASVVARLVLGYGLQIQTAVTTYRIHASLPNRRVSLIMKTSSIGTACIAAEDLSSTSILNNPAMLQYQEDTQAYVKVDKVSSNNIISLHN